MRIDPAAFMPPAAVARTIAAALAAGRPLSLIRIGDGEALTMAQGTVRSIAYVKSRGFLRHAGVVVPDLRARELVVRAVRRADIVGVASRRDLPDFAPLTEKVFDCYRLVPARICDCCINYHLQAEGLLIPLLRAKRLFLVNRRWQEWARALKRLYGLQVAGGAAVDHFGQVGAALAAAAGTRFQIALCAAGVPATWLAVNLAERHGCVALDLGRLADLMVELDAETHAN